uniref:Uncharacterized protein n=1 Tax=Pseudodiaptomus poplesia TaxID=213370 RepID=A0A0U2LFX4_9MAXI|nr:hypothetical protein [Pseudodiaptomus poplesia]
MILFFIQFSLLFNPFLTNALESSEECKNKDLKDFAGDVGYGVHAMTSQDISFFFGYDLGEENFAPTMNLNLTQENKVLDHAPSFQSSFRFPTARKLDLVMLHSDEGDKFYQVGATYKEKLNAMYYSLERLHKASKIYKEMIKLPTETFENECACIRGEQTNLEIKAFLLELSEIMRGLYPKPKSDGTREPPKVDDPFFSIFKAKEERCQKPGLQTQLKQLCSEMPPELKDSKSWAIWKAMKRNGYNDNAQQRLALYFYCKGKDKNILPQVNDKGDFISIDQKFM